MRAPPGLLRRHRDFRMLWTGQTVSQFGTQITFLALPLLAVRQLNATTFEVGLLTTAEFAAFLLVGLPAGAWVDRMRRRPVLVAADLGRAAALVSVPVAAAAGGLTMAQLYAVALVHGVLTVFFDVAYQSYLPALVSRNELIEGNARLEVSRSAAQVAGPGLGGALIQALTAPYALLADAASFLASAGSLLRIRRPEPAPPRGSGPSLRREIGEGLRFVLGHPVLRSLAGAVATFNLFSSVYDAVVIVFLARVLQLSPGVIGVLFTVSALGGLIGAVLTDRVSRRVGSARAIWLVPICTYPFWLLVPVSGPGPGLALFCVGNMVAFAGTVVFNVNAVSFRQAICPPELLGRMTATMRFLVWGTLPLGGLLGGALGARFGVHAALWVGCAGPLLSTPWLVLSPLRRLRELPGGEPEEPEPGPPPVPAPAAPAGQLE